MVNGEVQRRKGLWWIPMIFEDNALSRIEGDYTLKSGTEEPALTENEDQTAAEAAE